MKISQKSHRPLSLFPPRGIKGFRPAAEYQAVERLYERNFLVPYTELNPEWSIARGRATVRTRETERLNAGRSPEGKRDERHTDGRGPTQGETSQSLFPRILAYRLGRLLLLFQREHFRSRGNRRTRIITARSLLSLPFRPFRPHHRLSFSPTPSSASSLCLLAVMPRSFARFSYSYHSPILQRRRKIRPQAQSFHPSNLPRLSRD